MDQIESSNNSSDEETEPLEAEQKSATVKKPKKAHRRQKRKQGEAQNSRSKKIGRTKREFPQVSLEDALKVAQAIRQKNNGHPWDTTLVAKACGLAPRTMKFFYLASAARDYGLTLGSRDTPQISLTELGHDLVYATSPELEREKKIEAFFKVEKFKQVYDFYV